MKYDDARLLFNPLRDRKGISLKDITTVERMKAARRYPIPEQLVNLPEDHEFYIDSIVTQAYNSDENAEWTRYR
jgi:hypothetical protein